MLHLIRQVTPQTLHKGNGCSPRGGTDEISPHEHTDDLNEAVSQDGCGTCVLLLHTKHFKT